MKSLAPFSGPSNCMRLFHVLVACLEGIEEGEGAFRLHDGRFGGYAWLPSGAVCSHHYPRLRQQRARAGQCVPNQQVTRRRITGLCCRGKYGRLIVEFNIRHNHSRFLRGRDVKSRWQLQVNGLGNASASDRQVVDSIHVRAMPECNAKGEQHQDRDEVISYLGNDRL